MILSIFSESELPASSSPSIPVHSICVKCETTATEKKRLEEELAEAQEKLAKAKKYKDKYKTKLSDAEAKLVEIEDNLKEKQKDVDYLQGIFKDAKAALAGVLKNWPSDKRRPENLPDISEIPPTPSPSQVSIISTFFSNFYYPKLKHTFSMPIKTFIFF